MRRIFDDPAKCGSTVEYTIVKKIIKGTRRKPGRLSVNKKSSLTEYDVRDDVNLRIHVF